MVNYDPRTWFSLIFHSYSRQVLKTLLPALIFMLLYTAVICYLILDHFDIKQNEFPASTSVHSLLGIVLGLFLVFRTNSAYDRWWEGRRLWGGIVNSTRNFAFKLNAYLESNNKSDRDWFAAMIPNFVFATKEHLRKGVDYSELQATDALFLDTLQKAKHKPNKLLAMMYQKVNESCRENKISGDQLINLDKELKDFTDLMGACERIKNTPIPYSYSMFIKKFIFIYIITLPFGFISTFGYFTVVAVLLMSFVLLSVELIAEEIEDPFGQDVNDLPTDALALKIQDNIQEILQ